MDDHERIVWRVDTSTKMWCLQRDWKHKQSRAKQGRLNLIRNSLMTLTDKIVPKMMPLLDSGTKVPHIFRDMCKIPTYPNRLHNDLSKQDRVGFLYFHRCCSRNVHNIAVRTLSSNIPSYCEPNLCSSNQIPLIPFHQCILPWWIYLSGKLDKAFESSDCNRLGVHDRNTCGCGIK